MDPTKKLELLRKIYPLDDLEEYCETHISLVLLTPRYVYKLKKPVCYDFVDYSSSEKRWIAACAEVDLNRRLSEGLYLGVSLLNTKSEPYTWGSESRIQPSPHTVHIDYLEPAVVMRRLSEKTFLRSIVEDSIVNPDTHLNPLAVKLVRFHESNKIHDIETQEYLARFTRFVHENFKTLSTDPVIQLIQDQKDVVGELENYTHEILPSITALMRSRADKDFVVNGHGDLRLEHIAYENLPGTSKHHIQIFDCIEFNPGLRELDAGLDIAFLLMDFEAKGKTKLSYEFAEHYLAVSEDTGLEELLPFFKNYRALVRAKVHLLRASQLKTEERARELNKATNFLSLAARYMYGITKPLLLMVCGLSGTGKTTISHAIARRLGAAVISSDVVRKEIHPIFASKSTQCSTEDYTASLYSVEAIARTYAEIFRRAGALLADGNPVIIDATFQTRAMRSTAAILAASFGAECLIVQCTLSEDETLRRLTKRMHDPARISDAGPDLLASQQEAWQEILPNEGDAYFRIDTAKNPNEIAVELLKLLQAR